MHMIYWDHYYNSIILLNLLIVIGLFTALRLFSGVLANIKASDELLRKDNPAFGISLAGATFAVTVMLSGTIYGSPENDVQYSILSVGILGLIGIGMMSVTRLILDKLTLRSLSMRDEIVNGNIAAAIADAGNFIAAAIIIRTVMIWVTVTSLEGYLALAGGYVLSQIILTGMTLAKIKIFEKVNQGRRLQDELQSGNSALALRFAGRKIGTAFAIATAAKIVVYEVYDLLPIMGAWFMASLLAVLVWKLLCIIAERIILFRVNRDDEVLRQKNIAVGALQAVIYISMGLLISSI